MKTSIPSVLITFSLVCFALVQNTQALNPPPDGGYPEGNTAEGQAALFSLTTGVVNYRQQQCCIGQRRRSECDNRFK
jgi:hypothetical protein